ncbi:uncharacterized protein FOMMEDRAFT_142460 [Fomitiporia mediterranea MF3/22]|uniref:uncharacterized protein n=1 Tax=Fomitiporia mediterranea (strain MF3/22) TaxID=694068 RepID=UPI0004407604|nr:uncharacterized protein FOMMEDRAFT_142460 [Fomitiporia mediterranea MF3/22]EJC99935.1 hypothetical protein FOMMEDRAFT_142460 [Fomitiporia mediterranea MF3/22]
MSSEASIAPCASSPQLMPFHIGYSGPAPITTFFRVGELDEESPSAPSDGCPSIVAVKDAVQNQSDSLPTFLKTKIRKRLIAAFRGRRVVGTEVSLPEGYTGLVMISAAPGTSTLEMSPIGNDRKENGRVNGSAKFRRKTAARGSRRTKPIDIDDDDGAMEPKDRRSQEMDADDAVHQSLILHNDSHEGEVRTLKATQTFRSLLVWNADIAVDEGRDEYIRALREWAAIAAEIHRTED